MGKQEKLLKKFLENPIRSDLTFKELSSLLESFGYKKKQGSGSRVKFIHPQKSLILIHKPHPSDILKKYLVKELQKILKNIS